MINQASMPLSRNFAAVAGVKTGIGKLNLDVALPNRTNSFKPNTQRNMYATAASSMAQQSTISKQEQVFVFDPKMRKSLQSGLESLK
jgi:hypothetical protein